MIQQYSTVVYFSELEMGGTRQWERERERDREKMCMIDGLLMVVGGWDETENYIQPLEIWRIWNAFNWRSSYAPTRTPLKADFLPAADATGAGPVLAFLWPPFILSLSLFLYSTTRGWTVAAHTIRQFSSKHKLSLTNETNEPTENGIDFKLVKKKNNKKKKCVRGV